MKLFTLLLLIAVLSNGFAQEPPRGFYKGTLTYADGKTEEGYIKCPFEREEKKIKFIPLKGEDVVKVNSDELKSLTFTTEKSTYQFDRLRTAIKKTVLKKKYWLYLDSKKSCAVLSCYVMGKSFSLDRRGELSLNSSIGRTTTIRNGGVGAGGVSVKGGSGDAASGAFYNSISQESVYINYYLKKANDENANMVGGKMGNKYWKTVFKDDPEILKRMEEGQYDVVKGKEKLKRAMKGESKTSIAGDGIEAVVNDYCELHKEK